jgi:hypothetical protein
MGASERYFSILRKHRQSIHDLKDGNSMAVKIKNAGV